MVLAPQGMAPLHAQGLSSDSPFLAAPTADAQAGPQDLQLTGLTCIGDVSSVCLVESGKKGKWIAVGSSEGGIEVISCNLEANTATVRQAGNTRILKLRQPMKAAAAKGAAPGGPNAQPQPPLPQGIAQAPANRPIPQPLPGDPPPDIGPAGGQLPPIVPVTTREDQEREARMLVSDLMEIGMRQRKAYEEAQKKAKADQQAAKASQNK